MPRREVIIQEDQPMKQSGGDFTPVIVVVLIIMVYFMYFYK